MGGGGFATGDMHLQIPVFDEPTPTADNSPSILVGCSGQNNEAHTNVAHEYPSTSFQVNVDTLVYGVDMPNVHQELSPQHLAQPHHQPTAASQACEPRELSTRATPSPPAAGNRDNLQLHNTASVGSTPRRRRFRVRRSPPSQRRSQFASIAEKFLRIEEGLDLERRVVAVLESHVEMERLMVQANLALGGLKAVADILNKK